RPAPDVPDVAGGQRLGLARGAGDGEENPLLRGVRLTPSGVTFDPNRRLLTQGRTTPLPARLGEGAAVPLAAALGAMMRPGPDEAPRLRALPGAFVPELGGFTDRPLFEQPMLISSQLRGGGIPENFVPLPGGGYIDLSATPEARARALAEQQRQEELARQSAAARTLARLLGMSDEEIAAAANLTPDQVLAIIEARRAAQDQAQRDPLARERFLAQNRKSTRLNSSHVKISYADFCSKKKRT